MQHSEDNQLFDFAEFIHLKLSLATMGGLFRANEGTLAAKMIGRLGTVCLMATISLLQQMKILPTEIVCDSCEVKICELSPPHGNFVYFQCPSCKVKKSVRDDTVVSNSNLKLDRFVMLIWSFASERNRTYEQVMRGACLARWPWGSWRAATTRCM